MKNWFCTASAAIIGFYIEFSSLVTLLAGVVALVLVISIILGK